MAEIIFLQKLMKKKHYKSVLIVTDPPHSRRVGNYGVRELWEGNYGVRSLLFN